MRKLTTQSLFFTLISLFFLNTSNVQAGVSYDETLNVEEYSVGFLLSWSTKVEENNKYFLIERSLDGKTFKNIGKVVADVDADNKRKYSFEDLMLGLETAHYRLRQVDVDGTYNFTEVVSSTKFIKSTFTINTSEEMESNMYAVTIESLEAASMQIMLNNSEGEIVQNIEAKVDKGFTVVPIDLSFENPGNYTTVLKIGGEMETLNLIRPEDNKKETASKAKKSRG